jgi:protoporphyrinogen oxidase
VWGIDCKHISKEWGAQRIKSLDISKAILHAMKSLFLKNLNNITTLIEEFNYPKYGPGQLWQVAIDKAVSNGAKLLLNTKVIGFERIGYKITNIKLLDLTTGNIQTVSANFFISTMPIKDLSATISPKIEKDIYDIAFNLQYRDFISAGLLYQKLLIKDKHYRQEAGACTIPDNWGLCAR